MTRLETMRFYLTIRGQQKAFATPQEREAYLSGFLDGEVAASGKPLPPLYSEEWNERFGVSMQTLQGDEGEEPVLEDEIPF